MTTLPLEEFLRTPMNDRAFTHYELFVSFRFINFSCKINRINPLVIISSKLPAITNVMHKLLWVLQTIPNNNLNRIQVIIRSLAATYKLNSATALCWLMPPVIVM